MINQQLLDFIKSQLLKGVDKETITSDLVSNGWALVDIEDGFNSPIINPSKIASPVLMPSNEPIFIEENHSNKKLIFTVVGILLFIALVVSGYFFRNNLPIVKDLIKSSSTKAGELTQDQILQAQIEKSKLEEAQQDQTPVVTETTPEQDLSVKTEEKTPIVTPVVASKVVVKNGQIDCGKDMTCFLNATKTCLLAVVEQDQTVDEHVFNRTERRRMTLTGFNPSKNCGFISQIINSTVDYTTEYKTQTVYKNLTNEEKQQWLIRTNAEVRDTIGDTFTCEIPFNSLIDLITNFSKGIYSNSRGVASGSCENSKVINL